MNNAKSFKDNGYLIIPKILSGELLDFIGIYAYNRARIEGCEGTENNQVPNTPMFDNDYVMENLSDFLLPKIESAVGMKLLPTYTFFRVYKAGDILKKHKDRPACEVSATMLIGANYSPTWPLYIEGESIVQEPGDMAVYRGCEVEHWRDPMVDAPEDAYHVQLFLHYVDADGPYSMCQNDEVRL